MANLSETVRKNVLSKKQLRQIDLNTDFGQTGYEHYFEEDSKNLLNFVSSVNIPCCVHDGNPLQVSQNIIKANQAGCSVGAHIAYPDPKHYGYKPMDISLEELEAWIILQLGVFSTFCKIHRLEYGHIRPHGALYAQFITNKEVAFAIAKAIYKFDPWTILIAPIGPIAEEVQAETGLQVAQELYLGKRFTNDGFLDLDQFEHDLHLMGALEQVKQIAGDDSITTEDGKTLDVNCKTIHISPKHKESLTLAERITNLYGNRPNPLSLGTAGDSGWL